MMREVLSITSLTEDCRTRKCTWPQFDKSTGASKSLGLLELARSVKFSNAINAYSSALWESTSGSMDESLLLKSAM